MKGAPRSPSARLTDITMNNSRGIGADRGQVHQQQGRRADGAVAGRKHLSSAGPAL
jgi:hypothetical protein